MSAPAGHTIPGRVSGGVERPMVVQSSRLLRAMGQGEARLIGDPAARPQRLPGRAGESLMPTIPSSCSRHPSSRDRAAGSWRCGIGARIPTGIHHPDQPSGQRPVVVAGQQSGPGGTRSFPEGDDHDNGPPAAAADHRQQVVERLRLVTGFSMGRARYSTAARFPGHPLATPVKIFSGVATDPVLRAAYQ